jgi:hypothetical protein
MESCVNDQRNLSRSRSRVSLTRFGTTGDYAVGGTGLSLIDPPTTASWFALPPTPCPYPRKATTQLHSEVACVSAPAAKLPVADLNLGERTEPCALVLR